MAEEIPSLTTDAVSTVSAYKAAMQNTAIYKKYENRAVDELLYDYHCTDLTQQEKDEIKNIIFLKTFFLIPHMIKSNYYVNQNNFDDSVQNTCLSVLQAIEAFNPKLGFKFVNYLAGYFKSGISKTFKDANVVTLPPGYKKDPNQEVAVYLGVEYTENSLASDDDADKYLHNIDLVQRLEDAISKEADVLTEDERNILIKKYGLFGHKRMSYREISAERASEHKGSAYSRITQIHSKAVKKLATYFQDFDIEEY